MKHVIFAIHKNPAEEKNLIISKLLIEDYIDGNLRLFGQERKELPYAHKDAIGCTVDYVAGCKRYNGLDVGFAYDGDADRCLCVDELGNVITGDHILYIYGKYMKECGKLVTNTDDGGNDSKKAEDEPAL